MKRLAVVAASILILAASLGTAQAVRTLYRHDRVERERDAWQRPDDVIGYLGVRPGSVVVDLGSGAGYFALKIAPRLVPGGHVLAVDLRRQPLAILRVRAAWRGHANVRLIPGAIDDPKLPPGPIDAVLIANAYHELTNAPAILGALHASLRTDGRLVVVDRGPHQPGGAHAATERHHGVTVDRADRDIAAMGFERLHADERFVERADDDPWWLLVFRKP